MLTQGKKDLIVVPYDFTDQANTALMHASTIAAQHKDEVRLFHVLDDQTNAQLKKLGFKHVSAEQVLTEICKQNEKAYGVTTTFFTKPGNFLTEIGEYIQASNAGLCVMGTHGVKGMQHIVGANSLKVVSSSPAPVIIVQKRKMDPGGYKKIVLPIDANKRGKNKIAYTAALAKYFQSEVYIFEAYTDDEFVAHVIGSNTQLAKEYFKHTRTKFSITREEPGKGNYEKQLIRYAGEIGADLVAISSHHDVEGVIDFFMSHHETQIINNDLQMAVMCINPMEAPDNVDIGSFNW
jgi:nucleotide-binding universal stress UspA family protein